MDMNKFSLIELPNNKMEIDIQGDPAEIALLIEWGMKDKDQIRLIVLAAVMIWAQTSKVDLYQLMSSGLQAIAE